MPRNGENIYLRKDGRWEGRYVLSYGDDGKAKYGYVYAKTYEAARQLLAERKNPESAASYGDLLDAWLQSVGLRVKESTKARYAHLVETHIRPQLGAYPLSQISAALVEDFAAQKLRDGRIDCGGGLSEKTVTDILTVVKSTLEYASSHDWQVSCHLGKFNVRKRDHEARVLDADEQDALVRVLQKDMDRYKFGTLLSLYTGIRIGELCALQCKDLRLSEGTLKITKTMQRIRNDEPDGGKKTKVVISDPKSSSSVRQIPLPSCIAGIAGQFKAGPEAYLLTGRADKFAEPRAMQYHFRKYVEESGIEHVNFHALRHTFATHCIEIGFDVKSLSEILGHSSVNITLNRYVHSSFAQKQAQMEKLKL